MNKHFKVIVLIVCSFGLWSGVALSKPDHFPPKLAYSFDGTLLAVTDVGKTRVYESQTLTEVGLYCAMSQMRLFPLSKMQHLFRWTVYYQGSIRTR